MLLEVLLGEVEVKKKQDSPVEIITDIFHKSKIIIKKIDNCILLTKYSPSTFSQSNNVFFTFCPKVLWRNVMFLQP